MEQLTLWQEKKEEKREKQLPRFPRSAKRGRYPGRSHRPFGSYEEH